MMDSSRIFVKNIPPSITEKEFRAHFSAKGRQVTDVKIIPHRRIGYVGYKSSDEANDAVKYFNRTFIRMSRVAVELAKPVSSHHRALSFGSRQPCLTLKHCRLVMHL
jgi:multiple RNA-binding domain-containing protein 1